VACDFISPSSANGTSGLRLCEQAIPLAKKRTIPSTAIMVMYGFITASLIDHMAFWRFFFERLAIEHVPFTIALNEVPQINANWALRSISCSCVNSVANTCLISFNTPREFL
jgi:hypothetical protein